MAFDQETLPRDADNYDAYCGVCRRVHPYYTMTREGYEALIRGLATDLAARIDADIAANIYADIEMRQRERDAEQQR
jgi:hypothetical protein